MTIRVTNSWVLAFTCLWIGLAACDQSTPSEDPAKAPKDASQPVAEADGKSRDWQKLYALIDARQRSIIRDFLGGRRDGVFVDIGSYHYRDRSMTYFLEDEFGWSGVAVDAQAHFASDYAKHRPRTRFYSYIVTDRSGAEQPFYELGLGSTAVEGRADAIAALHAGPSKVTRVPTITLTDLLTQAGITKIDFLSMDIEGGEPRALAGFDIERFRPELVGIEALPESQEAILAYFEAHAYRRLDGYLARDKNNWFFTCKDEAACAADTNAGD